MPATLRIALLLLDEPLSSRGGARAAFELVPKGPCRDECRVCKCSTLRITAPMRFFAELALLLVTYRTLAHYRALEREWSVSSEPHAKGRFDPRVY